MALLRCLGSDWDFLCSRCLGTGDWQDQAAGALNVFEMETCAERAVKQAVAWILKMRLALRGIADKGETEVDDKDGG